MDTLRQDLLYTFRRLRAYPGFTAVAILTLALGIGANTSVFSIVSAVLLRPLPYPESDRLVGVYGVVKGGRNPSMSPPNFLNLRSQTRTLEDLAAVDPTEFTITGAGEPVRLRGSEVSASFFDVLRAQPLIGRIFAPDENAPGKDKVLVLGYGLWQQRFGGRRDVVGSTVTIDGVPRTIVGVMPRGFSYPAEQDLWLPLEYTENLKNARGAWYLRVIARLKAGVSLEQSASEIATLGTALEKAYPRHNAELGFTTFPLHEALVGDLRPAFLVLLGAVGFVLLIACANVANLLLARAIARETELAVRTALGAGRGRLVRQLLTESLVLGFAGGLAGLLIAAWAIDVLVSVQPDGIPRLNEVAIDRNVAFFTFAVSLLTSVLFGAIPALHMTRSSLAASLKEGARTMAARGSVRTRASLVVAEMALAMMLLAGAGLLIKSFGRLQAVDPGFQPDETLSFELSLPNTTYRELPQISSFYDRLVERTRALPGVTAVGGVMGLPLSGFSFNFSFRVAGRPEPPPGQAPDLEVRVATPDYFRTLGIPLVRGRLFTDADRAEAPPVVILSEAAARRHFPNDDPIGKRIELGWRRGGPGTPRAGGEVVGVVGDVREYGLDEEYPAEIYLPMRQWPVGRMTMVVRTAVPPLSLADEVTQAVNAIDPNLPVSNLTTVAAVVAESIARPRFYMMLLATFASLALLLAAIGIFGVMSYTVSQRTREIGIRMALGAGESNVVSMVVRQAMALAVVGLTLGVVAALALSQTMATLLFDLSPTDPLTFAAVAAILALVAFFASWMPARRAASIDPMVALRAE